MLDSSFLTLWYSVNLDGLRLLLPLLISRVQLPHNILAMLQNCVSCLCHPKYQSSVSSFLSCNVTDVSVSSTFGRYARGLKADNYLVHANPFIPLESSFTVFSVICASLCCEDFSLLGSSYNQGKQNICVNFDPPTITIHIMFVNTKLHYNCHFVTKVSYIYSVCIVFSS